MPKRQTPTLELEKVRFQFSETQLSALQTSLLNSHLPAETYASKQSKYGTEHAWMVSTLKYWAEEFDWKKREEMINEVDHYTTVVQDEDGDRVVHFVGHFSEDPEAIPILFLHGWPGAFHEFIPAIQLLRASISPSFTLIAPAQPGFPGLSSPPPLERGYGMYDVAKLMDGLMCGLGYSSGYAAQGGDIGSVLARILSTTSPSCLCTNLNYLPLLPLSPTTSFLNLTPLETANANKALSFAQTGRGYGVMHGTRPGTIGMVVGSSPVALLAWFGEKFRDWTDETPSLDVILESATMWWITGSFPTSLYAYSELPTGVGGWHRDPKLYMTKPFGFSSFGKEIASAPRSWAAETGNLQFYKYHEKGGHFAAMERPQEFAEDMRECFSEIYPWREAATDE